MLPLTHTAPRPTTAPTAGPLPRSWPRRHAALLGAFARECKPRVNSLIVFTAMIGMLLACPGWPPMGLFIAASIGIALVASGAAAINCLLERTIDSRMARTRARPLPLGQITPTETLTLACLTCGGGLWVLHVFVNDLTLWLTLGTFLGYAVIYTAVLKPATPMNIVIGGASGAMPPLLGWAAMTGGVAPEALALFLIIFAWTPPHFWPLACYRRAEYARAGLPMLPVTHGIQMTCLHSLLYVVMLSAITLLPVTLGASGMLYLVSAGALNLGFLWTSGRLWLNYSDATARRTFRYSIVYLTALFFALLVDHYL